MTNFLLTLIVVLIVGNQSWRLIKRKDERPNDMDGELFVAYIIAFVLILVLASVVSFGLLMFKDYLLQAN
jgi:hypothetical protein